MIEIPDYGEAVKHDAQNLLVIAPPGCGKTELLARRAALLIPRLSPNQKILALTFSNKAKSNLTGRLVSVLGVERTRKYVSIHNFHGHAAEIVRAHGRTLGIDPQFNMPDKRTQSDAIAPLLDGLSENVAGDLNRRIEEDLRNAKQRPNSDCQVLEALAAHGITQSAEIESARQESGTIYYDDLLRHAQRLIRVPEIASLYRKHYGAMLVDEFQDLSPQQLDLAIRSCEQSRTFVGDPLQGIYSWTGARPIDVERRLRKICGEPVDLGVSYRSSPRVLGLLNLVSVGLGGQALQPKDPNAWFEEGITVGAKFSTGAEEAAFIERASGHILKKQPSATIGIICRAAWRRKPIDAVFAESSLPSTRWDLAVDDAGIIELINDATTRLGGNPDLAVLKTEVLARIDATDLDTAADVAEALDHLEKLATDAGSIQAALMQFRILDQGDTAIRPGVHLLNAHTGKGQQFDWVFIPGFEQGHVPSFLAKKQSEIAEEHRVLLVMLSRARHGVILSRADSLISKKGQPYSTRVSTWANELRIGLITDQVGLLEHVARMPEQSS
ncbi:UvrD-helicase domain-containing protein (plasmid) [Glutamicibacter bergerei]